MKKKFYAFWETFKSLKQKRSITPLDIAIFLRQLATLQTAGISILHCLEVIEKNQTKISMGMLIWSIKRELLSGKDISTSMHAHGQYFDELTCQLVRIGEHTGKLDMTLQMIADEHEKKLAFKKRMKQALFYPCILFTSAILVTISLFLFVIPRFAELFADANIQLPLLTRILFFLSAKLNEHFYLLFFPFIIIFFLKLFTKKIPISWIYKLPFIHSISQKILLARFSRHLAMTFTAGIPIMDALKLLTWHAHHLEFAHNIFQLRNKMQSGLQLHQAMQSLTYFPDLMIQMVKMGETSGSLDQLLLKVAGMMEADIDDATNRFSQLLEPLIMLVLGVLIGGLIVGMYLPIFRLGSIL